MTLFPTYLPADISNCSFSPVQFLSNPDPQLENMRALLWRHNKEHDFPQLLIAHNLIYVGYSSDKGGIEVFLKQRELWGIWGIPQTKRALFTKLWPSPRLYCIHFEFLFRISLPSFGSWSPLPSFPPWIWTFAKDHQEPPDCHHCLCLNPLTHRPAARTGYPLTRPLI